MDVIINADDFGLTKGINEGILDAHINGVVTRATLMMNGLAVDDAIQLAKANPTLKVGIHLALTYGSPLLQQTESVLTNTDGTFKYASTDNSLSEKEVEQIRLEWHHQIKHFLESGLTLDHIDSHHHVHGWSDLKDVVLELSNHYKVPVRYTESLKAHPENLLTDSLFVGFYKKGVKMTLFEELSVLAVDSVEVMTHPAVVDEDLKRISSYADPREKETDILKSLSPLASMRLV